MSKIDKAKNVGKFIILMLCFAILFFLLLPFLEDSSAVSEMRNKKASPQIFTSNPLTDLVQKIYSLLSPREKTDRTVAAPIYASAGQGETFPVESTAPQIRYAAEYTESLPEEKAESGSSSGAYFPESYDYGNAEFINEEGEWVLVRQTAPDAAQRGMHDINTSDTPYDRLIRLERTSRYITPAPETESKWARIFRPIKNLFGLDHSVTERQTVAPPSSFHLASVSGSSAQEGTRKPTERFAHRPGLDIPAVRMMPGNRHGMPAAPAGWNILDALDPAEALQNLKDAVIDWYQPETRGQELSPADKNRRQEALKIIAEKHIQFRQERLAQIQQDAAEQEPAILEDTFLCYGTASASYHSSDPTSCALPPSPEEQEQQKQKEMAEAQKQGTISLNTLTQTLGFVPPPLNVVVVLGKEKADIQLQGYESPQEALTKEFYNFMSASNCPDGQCYWVAANNDAQALVAAMGGELYTDPLKITPDSLQAFKEAKLQQAREEGKNEEEIQQLQTELDGLQPPYVAYNTQQWNELQAYPSSSNQENKVKPSLFLTPTAANAQTFAADTRLPAAIFYDTTGQVLNGDAGLTPAQQGAIVMEQVVQRAGEVKKEIEDMEKILARMRLDGALSNQIQQAQQELEQKKKEWEQLRNMSR